MQHFFRRIFPFVVLVFGIGWIFFSRAEPVAGTAGLAPAPQVGFPAPGFSLETLQGETINLNELRGRPVVVNFWASWCPPCRAEMPAMQAVHDDYSARITFLAVNAASQDTLADTQAFVTSLGLSIPIPLDIDGAANRSYAVTSLPTTFFIDADGIIQDIVIGGPMTEAGLRARIENILEGMP